MPHPSPNLKPCPQETPESGQTPPLGPDKPTCPPPPNPLPLSFWVSLRSLSHLTFKLDFLSDDGVDFNGGGRGRGKRDLICESVSYHTCVL